MTDFMKHEFNIKKITVACFVPAGTGHVFHENRPSHGLAFHTGGEKVYTFSNGKTLTVKQNTMIYLPKNSTYKVTSVIPGDCYAINFEIDGDVIFSPFVMKISNYVTTTEFYRSACRVWYGKKAGYTTKCKAELYNILYSMKNEYFSDYSAKDKRALIKTAVEYIHESYTSKPLKVEELSAMCGITPEYFRKIFGSIYGISPVKYINALKIARARELLDTKMYSVSEVCFLSGFCDESHFSREFKRATGVPPSKYK